jgi:hypothetical protein
MLPNKRITVSLLFVQIIVTTAWSQTVKPKTIQQAETSAKPVKNRVIKGKVTDYVTKAPLPKMKVQIKDTYLYAITDKYGNFHLELPDSFHQKTLILGALYPEPGSEPEGTTILDVDVDVDNISRSKEIMIYRYPQEVYEEIPIEAWKKNIFGR